MKKYKGRIGFDEQIDKSLNRMMDEMKNLGIRNPSRPMALKKIIEMNETARVKILRKPRSKNQLIFK